MHAEKCPVCEGSGKYKKKECHGCDGKGWILIPEEKQEKEYVPYPVYPRPYIPEPYISPWESPWTNPIVTYKYITGTTGTTANPTAILSNL